jgi:hypothetical protein
MPIAQREFVYLRPQRGGGVRARERHVDHLGRDWYFSSLSAGVAEATVRRDTRDLGRQLQDREFHDLVKWTEAGNDPTAFAYVELVQAAAIKRLLRHFAELPFDDALSLAARINSYTAAQIATAAEVSLAVAQRVKDRAAALVSAKTLRDADAPEALD